MAGKPITVMSEVNQTILMQLVGQCEVKGAMVRHGTDQLKPALKELGPNTLMVSNIQGVDGDLYMDVAIRYMPEPDTYEALICHVSRAADGFNLDRNYEIFKDIYFDQFPDLIAGEYCGDDGNVMPKHEALAWENAGTPTAKNGPAPDAGMSM